MCVCPSSNTLLTLCGAKWQQCAAQEGHYPQVNSCSSHLSSSLLSPSATAVSDTLKKPTCECPSLNSKPYNTSWSNTTSDLYRSHMPASLLWNTYTTHPVHTRGWPVIVLIQNQVETTSLPLACALSNRSLLPLQTCKVLQEYNMAVMPLDMAARNGASQALVGTAPVNSACACCRSHWLYSQLMTLSQPIARLAGAFEAAHNCNDDIEPHNCFDESNAKPYIRHS